VDAGTESLHLRIGLPPADPHLCGGIVTAYNPASRLRPEAANREANARLRLRLEALGAEPLDVVAVPEEPGQEAWREPGFLARHLPCDALVAIGAEHGQNAIVWVPAGGAPRLVCTRDGFAGRRAGETIPGNESDDARSEPHDP
jgi:hypothetical protein